MTITIDKKWNIYSIFLIIQALHSLRAWFLWGIKESTLALISLFVVLLFMHSTPAFWNFKDSKRLFIAGVILLFYLYRCLGGNFNAYLGQFIFAFTIIPLIFLKVKYQIDLLERFQKVITVILAFSLFFWIFHLIGFDLPSTEITYGTIERSGVMTEQYLFDNHYFYLVNKRWEIITDGMVPTSFRFSSIFLEPGYLSLLVVFLLYINKFHLKDKRNIIYLATLIATISLAGFIVGIIAYVIHSLQNMRRGIVGIILLFLFLIFGNYFFRELNYGNNIINQGIIERLEYDESKQNIAGYNRTSEDLDDEYEEIISTNKVVYGVGRDSDVSSGVGYKKFIVLWGVVGLVIFVAYWYLIARLGNNYRANVLFLLYMLMFIRGDVTMFWHSFILVYVCGVIQTKYDLLVDEKSSTRSTPQRI